MLEYDCFSSTDRRGVYKEFFNAGFDSSNFEWNIHIAMKMCGIFEQFIQLEQNPGLSLENLNSRVEFSC